MAGSNTFAVFINKIANLKYDKQLIFIALFSFALAYPGHNYYQKLILKKGQVQGKTISGAVNLTVYPIGDGVEAPEISALSAVVKDVNSKSFIYVKNPSTPLYPASTTKIMTALVVLDSFSDLNQTITITNESQAIGHEMGLVNGETLTIKNLLYGLLVESGNDSALALANAYPGGYQEFVNSMNKKAISIGMERTTYKNPSGVEQVGHTTTARDLSVLATYAAKNPIINEIMQTKSITITDISGKYSHHLNSTNELLGKVQGLIGMKTGWTENAGECLVTYTMRDGNPIITVVLNSIDRFGESEELIEWAYSHHTWQVPNIDISYNY